MATQRLRSKPASKPASRGPRVLPFDEADELLDGALSSTAVVRDDEVDIDQLYKLLKAKRPVQKLDLELDGLTRLPAELYKLPAIRELKLGYDRLGKAELARIKKTWPTATIEVGIQR